LFLAVAASAAVPDKIAEQIRLAAAELGRNVEGAKRKARSGRGKVVATVGALPKRNPSPASSRVRATCSIHAPSGHREPRRSRPSFSPGRSRRIRSSGGPPLRLVGGLSDDFIRPHSSVKTIYSDR
jgi:hypothetical protein